MLTLSVISPHSVDSAYSWMKCSFKSNLATKDKWLYVWKTKHKLWCVYRKTQPSSILLSSPHKSTAGTTQKIFGIKLSACSLSASHAHSYLHHPGINGVSMSHNWEWADLNLDLESSQKHWGHYSVCDGWIKTNVIWVKFKAACRPN